MVNLQALITFLSLGLLSLLPRVVSRATTDPVRKYLSHMCAPLITNFTDDDTASFRNFTTLSDLDAAIASILAFSPYPCEQAEWIRVICVANGTTEIDFLAEQQCLCGGAFWEISKACSDCYKVHGFTGTNSNLRRDNAEWDALSTSECAPTPPYQPYTNLVSNGDIQSFFSSIQTRAPLTLGGQDQFPSDSAVSNYFTPTRSITAGEITGSATGRLTSWTNTDGVRYTPTSTPTSSTTAISSEVTSTSSASANIAAATDVPVIGGFVAIGLGVVAFL